MKQKKQSVACASLAVEPLADLVHEQWSGWMRYLFSKCREFTNASGEQEVAIPQWAVLRWRRQMQTAYNDLPEDEKASDRTEAHKFIELIGRELGL